MEQNEKHIEIDLVGLFHFLKKWIVIILATTLIFGAAGFLYTELFIDPVYVAETRIYVLNRSSTVGVQSNDFQLSDHILRDCQVLITGKNVTKKVVEQLELNMSPNALAGKISVSAPEETRVLQIMVTDTQAIRAAAIANKVCEVAAEQIKAFTDADAVHQVYEADVPAAPSGPNAKQNMLLWAVVGFVLAAGILSVVFVLDDSIRTEEDVERYLGMSVFGVIPDSRDIDSSPREKTAERKRSVIRNNNRK